jgi:hypothetical protein
VTRQPADFDAAGAGWDVPCRERMTVYGTAITLIGSV